MLQLPGCWCSWASGGTAPCLSFPACVKGARFWPFAGENILGSWWMRCDCWVGKALRCQEMAPSSQQPAACTQIEGRPQAGLSWSCALRGSWPKIK